MWRSGDSVEDQGSSFRSGARLLLLCGGEGREGMLGCNWGDVVVAIVIDTAASLELSGLSSAHRSDRFVGLFAVAFIALLVDNI